MYGTAKIASPVRVVSDPLVGSAVITMVRVMPSAAAAGRLITSGAALGTYTSCT